MTVPLRLATPLVALFAAVATLWAAPVRAIDIREVTSPGGIHAWLVQEPSIPFVALEIRFRGGTSLDAPGKRGATNLMMALIEEGAGDLDARAFAARAEELAAEFRFGADDDQGSVSARFLTENRDASVDLLRAALRETRFDADAIERVRGQVLSTLRSNATDPGAIALEAFYHQAFGDHPYGTPGDGTETSVAALTREDLVAARDGLMARDRLFVSAVGDITEDQLGALLDHLLGDLPATGAAMPGPTTVTLDGGVTVVPFATPQSVIMFGQPGIEREDPDFFPAYVLNEVLGGSRFTARLMREVREKRGLTYGISSSIANMDHADIILGRVATQNPRAGETIKVVSDEWTRAAREGVSEDEMTAAKTYLTGSFPLRFDGNGPIARILVGMQLNGYTPDYLTTRNASIEAVTMADITRVAARLLTPDALTFVVVGEPEGVGD